MNTRRLHMVPTLLLALAAAPAAAQGRGTPSATPRPWKLSTRFDVGADLNNNVFLLPTNRRDNLASPSAAEQLSGRYDLMRSPSDLVGTVRATAELSGSGLRGRRLVVTPGVQYEFFSQNAERRNVSASLALSQDLRRDGRVRVRAGFQPRYFARNYLTDAIDTDADGSITSGERRYGRGDYRAFSVEADYRLRLVKSRRARPFGAFLGLAVGYEARAFDEPFAARDLGGPTAGLRLDLSPDRRVEFRTSYDVAFRSSPVTPQVILVDEPVFGEDLNGNGNATDLNARAVRTVDRTRLEHVITEVARFEVGRRTDVELRVAYRIRTFSSTETYDVANNGRRDQRLQVGAELTRRVARDVRLITGVRFGTQRLNRRTDLGAEGAVGDYTRLQAHVGVRLTP